MANWGDWESTFLTCWSPAQRVHPCAGSDNSSALERGIGILVNWRPSRQHGYLSISVSQYLIQLLTYVVAKNIYRLYIYINYMHTHEYPVKSQCWMIIYLLGRNPQAKLLPGPKAAVEICWERHPWRNVARKDYTTGGQVILRCCQQLSIHPKLPKQWVNLLHPK